MKIGIDAILLRGKDAGALRIFEQLIAGLVEFASAHTYHVWGNQAILASDAVPSSANIHWHNVQLPRRLPTAIAHQILLARIRESLDVLHSPIFVPPLLYRGKTVMTVFDLTFKLYPETMKWTGRLWWQLLGAAGFKKANAIIALSENTKRDLCIRFGVAPAKVQVVYPCTRAIFKPQINPRQGLARYNLPERFILYVGTLERRKNIVSLIRAFALAKQKAHIAHDLILVGKRGWLYQDIFHAIDELNLRGTVLLLDYVPDIDLPKLYAAADLFVYISRYEGFGLPVLEAMACGTPVLASNVASLPEVLGDAGIMVPPDDVEQIANMMMQILSAPTLRQTLIAKGLARARQFSLERHIQQTISVYRRVIES